jgi:hypothetical protein
LTNAAPPQDAFYYGARTPAANGQEVISPDEPKAKDEEIQALKAREAWMKTALAVATRRGFVASDAGDGGEGLESFSKPALAEGNNREVVEALIQLKQELAKAKVYFVSSRLALPAHRSDFSRRPRWPSKRSLSTSG